MTISEGGSDIRLKGVCNVAKVADGEPSSDSDGVMVVSVWKQGPEGFLGRLTMTAGTSDTSVRLVTSPDELLESVREWLSLLA